MNGEQGINPQINANQAKGAGGAVNVSLQLPEVAVRSGGQGLTFPPCVGQSPREEAEAWGHHRADGGWEAHGNAREESPVVRLYLLRAAPEVHHCHHERTGILHFLRDPM